MLNKEKITCECGCEVTKCYLNRHLKSLKHKIIMNFIIQQFNNDDE